MSAVMWHFQQFRNSSTSGDLVLRRLERYWGGRFVLVNDIVLNGATVVT